MNAGSLLASLNRLQRNTFLAVIFFSAIGREAKEVEFTTAAERPVERGGDREQYPAGLPQP